MFSFLVFVSKNEPFHVTEIFSAALKLLHKNIQDDQNWLTLESIPQSTVNHFLSADGLVPQFSLNIDQGSLSRFVPFFGFKSFYSIY